jgi:hypothetical protein
MAAQALKKLPAREERAELAKKARIFYEPLRVMTMNFIENTLTIDKPLPQ